MFGVLAAYAVAFSTMAFCGLVILTIIAVVNGIGGTGQRDLREDDRLTDRATGRAIVDPSRITT